MRITPAPSVTGADVHRASPSDTNKTTPPSPTKERLGDAPNPDTLDTGLRGNRTHHGTH